MSSSTIRISEPEIKIPDLFESFLARSPELNSGYENVAEASISWMSEICNYTPQEQLRLSKADFAYFPAVAYPDAHSEKLRTMTDWFNWVFAFDDVLDDGVLVHKQESINYINKTAAVVGNPSTDVDPGTDPANYVLKTICTRLLDDPGTSVDAKIRWTERMRDYLNGLREAVEFEPGDTLQATIERYITHRVRSIGVTPLFTFVEYACNLQIPSQVFKHASMKELERIGVELQMLANDCVSYHREKALGCPHNIVHWSRFHGLSEQEAYDMVHEMMRQRYRDWYLARADMPVWGEDLDRQVQRYIKGIEDVALANAHWSFRTSRYFGKFRDEVRRTRKIMAHKTDWLESVLAKSKTEILIVDASFPIQIDY